MLIGQLEELKNALSDACERGRAARVTNRLPDPPQQWVPELIFRLQAANLVAYDRGAKRKRKAPVKGSYVRGVKVSPTGEGTLTLYDTHTPESVFKRYRDQRWAVVCGRHAMVFRCNTLKVARDAMRHPNFCDECAVKLPKKKEV